MALLDLIKVLWGLRALLFRPRSARAGLLFTTWLMLCAAVHPQSAHVDSLEKVLMIDEVNGPARVAALLDVAEGVIEVDHAKAYRYALEAQGLAQALGDHRSLSRALLLMVREHVQYLDNQFAAVGPGLQAIREAELAKDTLQLARAYIAMGLYNNAVAPEVLERNLVQGVIMARDKDDKKLLARGIYNLARQRFRQGRNEEALALCRESSAIGASIGDQRIVVANLVAIAVHHGDNEHRPDSALHYFRRGIALAEAAGELRYRSYSLSQMAIILDSTGHEAEALATAQQGLDLALENGLSKEARDAYLTFSKIHQRRGDYKRCYEYFTRYDSCESQATNALIAANAGRLQAEHAYTRERELAAAKNKERELLMASERKRQNYWLVFAICMGAAVAVIAALVFRSLQRTRKAKRTIEEQKKLVENKQDEIIASINYSKRLQDAILPSQELIEEYFPESFVLYMPKDIVAGDFYWLKRVDDMLFVATADCTGHGVPGALVSVVCASALREAVREFGVKDPGRVLDLVTTLVVDTFGHSGAHVKDGMDISLLAIDLKDRTVRWCGANIPLFYIPAGSNGVDRGPITTIHPDRQPVGRHENRKPFTTVTLDLAPGTVLYLFSDGFADQFGGEKDKKFMRRSFQKLLDDTAKFGLTRQGEILRTTIEEWRRDADQTDDITVMGIRF